MKYVIAFLIFVAVFCSVNINYTNNENTKVIEYKPSTGVTVKETKTEESDCTYTMCSAFGGGVVGDTMAINTMFGD